LAEPLLTGKLAISRKQSINPSLSLSIPSEQVLPLPSLPPLEQPLPLVRSFPLQSWSMP